MEKSQEAENGVFRLPRNCRKASGSFRPDDPYKSTRLRKTQKSHAASRRMANSVRPEADMRRRRTPSPADTCPRALPPCGSKGVIKAARRLCIQGGRRPPWTSVKRPDDADHLADAVVVAGGQDAEPRGEHLRRGVGRAEAHARHMEHRQVVLVVADAVDIFAPDAQ